MWEEVAECSSAIGRGGRVREVVKERLERGEVTPTLLCVLGDVTRDPQDYIRAWEMSGKRCGRAQRSLGLYHLRRKEVTFTFFLHTSNNLHLYTHAYTHTIMHQQYKECIPAFELSLKINSLQVWYRVSCDVY